MNVLIEKVAKAMHATSFDGVEYENEDVVFRGVYEDKARAAIKAVAEWLQEDGNSYFEAVGRHVEKQLKDSK
jgi:hypothetical protein